MVSRGAFEVEMYRRASFPGYYLVIDNKVTGVLRGVFFSTPLTAGYIRRSSEFTRVKS